MNKILIIFFTVLFFLTSSIGHSQNIICEKTGYGCLEIDFKDLWVARDGLHYDKFSDVPFTGKVKGKTQGSMKNGKREGYWVSYWNKGQLHYKGDYKYGKRDGSWVGYWDNGQLRFKGVYFKNGKKEDSWVRYWDNGNLMYKGNYKNTKREGSWIGYNKNGTVNNKYTGTFKDGVKISDENLKQQWDFLVR